MSFELTIPTSWHAGSYALPQDLVSYFPRGIWLLIASFDVDELIHALSDDKILAAWIKQINLQIIRDEDGSQMKVSGYRHNPFGGPAHIETDPDGSRIEMWYDHDKLHRINAPARIATNMNGYRSETWYENGKIHRIGEPAHIQIYTDGNRGESWYENDNLHRIGGPALIYIYPDRRCLEFWYENGVRCQH